MAKNAKSPKGGLATDKVKKELVQGAVNLEKATSVNSERISSLQRLKKAIEAILGG